MRITGKFSEQKMDEFQFNFIREEPVKDLPKIGAGTSSGHSARKHPR